jgi:alpha-tubulin suppressor-like RCC1 family protein
MNRLGSRAKNRRLLPVALGAGLCVAVSAACTALIGIEDLPLRAPVHVSSDSVAFGAVLCGTSGEAKTITLSNRSDQTYSWSAHFDRGTSTPFNFDPKSGVLPKGQEVAITITPSPVGVDASPGTLDDTLTIVTDLEGDTPHAVRIVEDTGVPKLVVTPAEGFPAQNYPVGSFTTAGSLTVANQGNAPMVLNFDGGGAVRVKPEGPSSVAPGASAVFEISVSPEKLGDAGDGVASLAVGGGAACVPSAVVAIPGTGVLSGASAIESGAHTCALVGDRVVCWGSNSAGQIGEANKGLIVATPTLMPGLRGVRGVTTGGTHTCAVLDDKSVWCWGNDLNGQLGHGTLGSAGSTGVPGRVANPAGGSLDAVAVTAGTNHTCSLSSAGTVFCWGLNANGNLGSGSLTPNASGTPLQVVGLTDAIAIGAGDQQTCALRADTTVVCWGVAINGQLGDGTQGDGGRSPVPVSVLAANDAGGLLSGVTALGVGFQHACALQQGGQVACWGYNSNGEVGVSQAIAGAQAYRPFTVTDVNGVPLTGVTSLSRRLQYTTCARLGDGTVLCWGSNVSVVRGNPGAPFGPTPSRVLSADGGVLTGVVGIGTGGLTGCSLQENGAVFCWGSNSTQQTGTGYPIGIVPQAQPVVGFP